MRTALDSLSTGGFTTTKHTEQSESRSRMLWANGMLIFFSTGSLIRLECTTQSSLATESRRIGTLHMDTHNSKTVFFRKWHVDYTDECNTPTLVAIGVRSSVRDMLIWARALLESKHQGAPVENPTRGIDEIWNIQIAVDSETHPEAQYCLGWYRGSLPGVSFGCPLSHQL